MHIFRYTYTYRPVVGKPILCTLDCFHIVVTLARSGLMKHPLDIRGSRRALEAARIFLDLERKRATTPSLFLGGNSLSLSRNAEPPAGGRQKSGPAACPTLACDWLAKNLLKLLRKQRENRDTGHKHLKLVLFMIKHIFSFNF
jgi:hypothetical protein